MSYLQKRYKTQSVLPKDHYEKNARVVIEKTIGLDVNHLYAPFLDVLNRLILALKLKGVIYMSFMVGDGERTRSVRFAGFTHLC